MKDPTMVLAWIPILLPIVLAAGLEMPLLPAVKAATFVGVLIMCRALATGSWLLVRPPVREK